MGEQLDQQEFIPSYPRTSRVIFTNTRGRFSSAWFILTFIVILQSSIQLAQHGFSDVVRSDLYTLHVYQRSAQSITFHALVYVCVCVLYVFAPHAYTTWQDVLLRFTDQFRSLATAWFHRPTVRLTVSVTRTHGADSESSIRSRYVLPYIPNDVAS